MFCKSIDGKMIGSEKKFKILIRQLFEAVHSNNIEEVVRILGLGMNVNVQDNLGQTPIFLAALYNNLSMVEKLAELGADLEVKDNLGYTMSSRIMSKDNLTKKTFKNKRLAIIKTLIKYGVKLTTYSRGALPIHRAIKERCNLNIVKTLLTEDTANAKDIFGQAPLHIAVWCNRINIVNLLIKYEHTDINQEDDKKNTPLMLAAYQNFSDIERLLSTHKAKHEASKEMNPLPSTVMSKKMESKNKSTHSFNYDSYGSQIKYQTLENKTHVAPFRPILFNSESRHNILFNLPRFNIFEASHLRMLDVGSPGSSISDASQHSTSAVLGSPSPSISGLMIDQFKRSLNIDLSSSPGSYTISTKKRKFNHILSYDRFH
ncbi:ankyrin repeat domain-containing protein [Candidatus Mesenet endosymbiont of Agriotes lineatus]|uniref:ankyrin repeat domain-containing protein n=1 Tax=Candidatus Mesenet endosymbiont of Agriotes lineatus TaxID=3077948 RepID=UPI0030CBB720